ncbi:RHO1 GDP-GTP exchange protein 2 [Nowakowskiella sp. JEL0407]|nr:RHO1 GDP-GTP exchange protein 2 [Nowakowskiella sp. JEL0407]
MDGSHNPTGSLSNASETSIPQESSDSDFYDVEVLADNDFETDIDVPGSKSKENEKTWRELAGPAVYGTVSEREQDRQEYIVGLSYKQKEFVDDLDFLIKFLESLAGSDVMQPPLVGLLECAKRLHIQNVKFLNRLETRLNQEFPLITVVADICEQSFNEFATTGVFMDYSRMVKKGIECFIRERSKNEFLTTYIESWASWSESEYNHRKDIELVMRSALHHLVRISTILERILSRLPFASNPMEKHADADVLPVLILKLKGMQRELIKESGVMAPSRSESFISLADGETEGRADTEVKQRLQESALESQKAFETVKSSKRNGRRKEKIKVELNPDVEFWHETVPPEAIADLNLGEKEVKRQGTIFEVVKSYSKYVEDLDYLAKIIIDLDKAIKDGEVVLGKDVISSTNAKIPGSELETPVEDTTHFSGDGLSERFTVSGKAEIRSVFEYQKFVKRAFVDPTAVMTLQATVLIELRERQRNEHPVVSGIGDVLLRNFLELEPVLIYAQKHMRVLKDFKRYTILSPSFGDFIEKKRKAHKARKDIADFYLARPKQFQFDLKLLINSLISQTHKSLLELKQGVVPPLPHILDKFNEEIGALTQASEVLGKSISTMEEMVKRVDDEMKIDELVEKKLIWTPRVLPQLPSNINPGVERQLEQIRSVTKQTAMLLLRGKSMIRDGPAVLREKYNVEHTVHVFLFENVMLITVPRNNGEQYKVFAKPIPLDLLALEEETTSVKRFQTDGGGTLREKNRGADGSVNENPVSFLITHLGQRREGAPFFGTYSLRFDSEFVADDWIKKIESTRETFLATLVPGVPANASPAQCRIFNLCEATRVPRILPDGRVAKPPLQAQIPAARHGNGLTFGDIMGNSAAAIAKISVNHVIVGLEDGIYIAPDCVEYPDDFIGPTHPIRLPFPAEISKVTAIEILIDDDIVIVLADKILFSILLHHILEYAKLPYTKSIETRVHQGSGAQSKHWGLFNNKAQNHPVGKGNEIKCVRVRKDVQYQWVKVLCDRNGLGGGAGSPAFSAGGFLSGLPENFSQEEARQRPQEGKYVLAAKVPSIDETWIYVFELVGGVLTKTKRFFIPSTKVTGVTMFRGIFVLHTDNGGFIKISYEDLGQTSTLLDKSQKLSFMSSTSKPLAVYRYDKGIFLVCYDRAGFFITSNGKWVESKWTIEWTGVPTGFSIIRPFLYVFEPDFIDIRDLESGERRQVIPVRAAKFLANLPVYDIVVNGKRARPREEVYFVQDSWSHVPISDRKIYRLRLNPESPYHAVEDVAISATVVATARKMPPTLQNINTARFAKRNNGEIPPVKVNQHANPYGKEPIVNAPQLYQIPVHHPIPHPTSNIPYQPSGPGRISVGERQNVLNGYQSQQGVSNYRPPNPTGQQIYNQAGQPLNNQAIYYPRKSSTGQMGQISINGQQAYVGQNYNQPGLYARNPSIDQGINRPFNPQTTTQPQIQPSQDPLQYPIHDPDGRIQKEMAHRASSKIIAHTDIHKHIQLQPLPLDPRFQPRPTTTTSPTPSSSPPKSNNSSDYDLPRPVSISPSFQQQNNGGFRDDLPRPSPISNYPKPEDQYQVYRSNTTSTTGSASSTNLLSNQFTSSDDGTLPLRSKPTTDIRRGDSKKAPPLMPDPTARPELYYGRNGNQSLPAPVHNSNTTPSPPPETTLSREQLREVEESQKAHYAEYYKFYKS